MSFQIPQNYHEIWPLVLLKNVAIKGLLNLLPGKQDVMVGNNNHYTTENTRKQGETTVGEGMIGGWQVIPTVGFLCFLVFSVL